MQMGEGKTLLNAPERSQSQRVAQPVHSPEKSRWGIGGFKMQSIFKRSLHPKAKTFDTLSEAFDWCREMNKPIVVHLPDTPCTGNRLAKIYPSGQLRDIKSGSVGNAIVHKVVQEIK